MIFCLLLSGNIESGGPNSINNLISTISMERSERFLKATNKSWLTHPKYIYFYPFGDSWYLF